jgi:hypothetical protein
MKGVDLTPADLCHVADFFNAYTYWASDQYDGLIIRTEFELRRKVCKASMEEILNLNKEEMVSCVQINCDGDVEVDKRPRHESLLIPVSHFIFDHAATDISHRIELPIIVRRIL